MTTRPIQPLDLSFLLNESRDCPQHVAGVMLLENPRAGTWTIAEMVQHYRAATPVAPFNVVPHLRRLGAPAWVEVDAFDMRYHVQHVALPAPGSEQQLDELVQQWHSEPLDLTRPLFQMTVVEGLHGGRFAIYVKMHHSIVDGLSAAGRLMAGLDSDPAAALRQPFFAIEGKRSKQRLPAGVAALLKQSLGGLKQQATSARELTGELLHRLRAVAAGERVAGSAPFGASAKLMNAPLRYGRSFAHLSLPMEPLRAAAKAHHGTLNDAFLAIVDAAVTRYLAAREQATTEPLHALVPVSLHEGDTSSGGGNAITGIICALGEPDADVHQRLSQVSTRMKTAKTRMKGLSKTAAMNYFTGLFLAAQGLGAVGLRRPVANYVVSNVPGTGVDMYLGGARLLGLHPVNLLAVKMGLSITLFSRAGQFDIGIIANRNVMPDVHRVAEFTREAFLALTQEAAAAPQPSARSATSRKVAARKAPPRQAAPAKLPARKAGTPKAAPRKAPVRKAAVRRAGGVQP